MDPNGKKEGRHEGLPFLRYNTYKDYHLMIFQALLPSNYQNNNNSMTTIPLHKISRKKSQFGKKPTKDRDLENNPHHQTHHHQRIHIRGQSNRVLHFHTDLMVARKRKVRGKIKK